MNRLAPKWVAHPVKELALWVVTCAASVLTSTSAEAESSFAEFRGVPEQLGMRTLAVDLDWSCSWSWSWLVLVVLVVALVAADRLRNDKLKRQERDE